MPSPSQAPGYLTAGGDVVCKACGRKLFDHPYDPRYKSWDRKPYLTVVCDGSLVKL